VITCTKLYDAPMATPPQNLLAALDSYMEGNFTSLLPVGKCWQPSDLLPDLRSPDWVDEVRAFRQMAAELPDNVLVTLVANMITEEALPSYHAWLANLSIGLDRSGTGSNAMARWIRGWVAEEKRHGDVLASYLHLSGRVDMRAIEVTIQNLLRNGFDPLTENDLIKGFIYTSFQERATYISHSGVARLARQHGETQLAIMCDNIAGDEVRHERAYERLIAKIFELTPDECMVALAAMLRKTIIMPSRTMEDGTDTDLFTWFSSVTQHNGIYTTSDYAKIMQHLVRLWEIDRIDVRSDAGKQAQEFILELPPRYLKLAERAEARAKPYKPRPVSWLSGRMVGQ